MFKLLSRVISIVLLSTAVFFVGGEVAAKSSLDNTLDLTDQGPSDNRQTSIKGARDIAFGKFSQEFRDFISNVATGQDGVITGIFAYDVLAMDVAQQPAASPGYISTNEDVVTEFGMARDYGTIGMLAHNYLAGETFFDLETGQAVYLVFGDGSIQKYTIVDILSYQALQPNSPYSNFLNLDNSGEYLTASDLFFKVYGLEDSLILQTCIENQGVESWGRLFVVAVPGDATGESG
jgi:hypothetical protein